GYLVSPIILLLGQQGYLPYKVASIVVSCIGIFLTYLLARRVADLRIALLTGLILATSSWYLVFSRLGNAQIAIPALVAASFCCLAWGVDRKNLTLPILGAVVASLGLYTMPQALILPFVYLVVSAFYFPLRRLVPLCCATLIASVPALMIIVSQQNL